MDGKRNMYEYSVDLTPLRTYLASMHDGMSDEDLQRWVRKFLFMSLEESFTTIFGKTDIQEDIDLALRSYFSNAFQHSADPTEILRDIGQEKMVIYLPLKDGYNVEQHRAWMVCVSYYLLNFQRILDYKMVNKSLKIVMESQKGDAELGANIVTALQSETSRLQEVMERINALLQIALHLEKGDAEDQMQIILEEIADSTMALTNSDALTIYITEHDPNDRHKKQLRSWVIRNVSLGTPEGLVIRLPFSIDSIATMAAREMVTQTFEDVYESPLFNPSFDKQSGYRTKSMLVVPLVIPDETAMLSTIGVFQLMNSMNVQGRTVLEPEGTVNESLIGNYTEEMTRAVELFGTFSALVLRLKEEITKEQDYEIKIVEMQTRIDDAVEENNKMSEYFDGLLSTQKTFKMERDDLEQKRLKVVKIVQDITTVLETDDPATAFSTTKQKLQEVVTLLGNNK